MRRKKFEQIINDIKRVGSSGVKLDFMIIIVKIHRKLNK